MICGPICWIYNYIDAAERPGTRGRAGVSTVPPLHWLLLSNTLSTNPYTHRNTLPPLPRKASILIVALLLDSVFGRFGRTQAGNGVRTPASLPAAVFWVDPLLLSRAAVPFAGACAYCCPACAYCCPACAYRFAARCSRRGAVVPLPLPVSLLPVSLL